MLELRCGCASVNQSLIIREQADFAPRTLNLASLSGHSTDVRGAHPAPCFPRIAREGASHPFP